MHINAYRAAGIGLTNQALKGCCLWIAKAIVDDGKHVNVAAAGSETSGRQGPMQDH
ncbi:hypothetical protein Areg01_76940 [Actinoplanes regularis]|nr:hypothetical protein Areg01_76940 [Actinoplanes regularis]